MGFQPGGIETLGPASGDILAIGAGDNISWHSHVKDFSHPGAVPTSLDEVFPQRLASLSLIATVHKRLPRRSAPSALAVGAIKYHGTRGQRVDVWRLAMGITIASQDTRLEVIGDDEQNIFHRLGFSIIRSPARGSRYHDPEPHRGLHQH